MPRPSRASLIVLLCSVAFLCFVVFVVTLGASDDRRGVLPDAALAGAKLFRRHCKDCHGSTADGGDTGPSLRRPDVLESSPAELFSILTNGDLRRGMPSWSRLPDERRWQLVAFIKSLPPAR